MLFDQHIETGCLFLASLEL